MDKSLDDMLKETLLLTASGKLTLVKDSNLKLKSRSERVKEWAKEVVLHNANEQSRRGDIQSWASGQKSPYVQSERARQAAEGISRLAPLWDYELGALNEVKNVQAFVPHMGHMMTVCSSIRWESPKVVFRNGAPQAFTLPLEKNYLLYSYYLDSGSIKSSETGFWQIPMELDQSFMRVFGYKYAGGKIQPMTLEIAKNLRFSAFSGAIASTPYLIVCQVLGCCKARKDFEPGGVLSAARIIPHYMILSNQAMYTIEAAVVMERPAKSSHTRMGNDEMNQEMKAVFFSDRNNPPVFPVLKFQEPYWSETFAYYCVNPGQDAAFRVVNYAETSTRSQKILSRYIGNGTYGTDTVWKMPRQGEFDSLHVAPTMRAPDAVIKACPPSWSSTLKSIYMAPFCVHDCLHTHWRWMNYSKYPKYIRGWSGTRAEPGLPFQKPGAPMVPPNQDIHVALHGMNGFTYKALIHEPNASQWQIVMHHGSAYAIAIGGLADLAKWYVDVGEIDLPGTNGDQGEWALFYWNLRYCNSVLHGQFYERLKIDSNMLKKLRSL